MKNRYILSGTIGNVLTMYDYSLFAFLATTLSQLFFPMANDVLALIYTFTLFSVSFLIKPIANLIFAHFIDRYGRKRILLISMLLMAIATTLIGFAPTYEQMGSMSIVIIIFARILQGIAVGGEFSTSATFLVEHAPTNQRGFIGSLAYCSGVIGMLIAALTVFIVTVLLSDEQLISWGWRIPFLLGFVTGIWGIYLRINALETEAFQMLVKNKKILKNPLLNTIKYNYISIIIGALITCLTASAFFTLFAYMPSHLIQFHQFSQAATMLISLTVLTLYAILLPLFGYLSDLISKKKLITIATFGLIIFVYPILLAINTGQLTMILLALVIAAILVAMLNGGMPCFLNLLFPTYNRASGYAISHGILTGILGGLSPVIAIYLINWTKNLNAPAYYIIAGGIAGLIGLLVLSRTNLHVNESKEGL